MLCNSLLWKYGFIVKTDGVAWFVVNWGKNICNCALSADGLSVSRMAVSNVASDLCQLMKQKKQILEQTAGNNRCAKQEESLLP